MTKRSTSCIIVHGCPDSPEKDLTKQHWVSWTVRELKEKGILAKTPLMPEPWKPKYERFKKAFEKLTVDENTVLIGHSCGCAFLVRWLGDTKQSVKKLILVAPWKVPRKGNAVRKAFYTYPIDPTIPVRVGEIVIFTADDEEPDGKKSVKMYRDVLGGKLIELKGHGHYILGDMGTEEFPELLKEIL